jgi:hypothetical protein
VLALRGHVRFTPQEQTSEPFSVTSALGHNRTWSRAAATLSSVRYSIDGKKTITTTSKTEAQKELRKLLKARLCP